jgi:hypothetical protein
VTGNAAGDAFSQGRLSALARAFLTLTSIPWASVSRLTHERDGRLVAEASQELQLAFECERSVRSAGDSDHE